MRLTRGGEISARFISPVPLGAAPRPRDAWPDAYHLERMKGWRKHPQRTVDRPVTYSMGAAREFVRTLTPPVGWMEVPPDDSDLQTIWDFALTFNAYERVGEALDSIVAKVSRGWRASQTMPDDLVAARCAMFFEQRRAHHTDQVSTGAEHYVRLLVGHIRQLSGGIVFGPPDPLP